MRDLPPPPTPDEDRDAEQTLLALQDLIARLRGSGAKVLLEWRRPSGARTLFDVRPMDLQVVGPLTVAFDRRDGSCLACHYRELDVRVHAVVPHTNAEAPP